MALKGTTKIELTNVKTGEVEVVEKHNLVTTAVENLLNTTPPLMLYDAKYSINANMLPVVPNLIGGILLYENPLDEDSSLHYAPGSNYLVGYSSNTVNTGTDVKRGSMNQTESGALEDGSGYRFVFDFGTSQANGKINSVGLTSEPGGLGNPGTSMSKYMYKMLQTASTSSWPVKQAAITSVDPEKEIAYAVYMVAANTIRVNEIGLWKKTVHLMSSIAEGNVVNTKTLTTTTFGSGSGTWYTGFCDGGDGYIYGFQHRGNAQGNSSGNAEILYIKIKKEDWTFTEGSFTLGAQIWKLGYQNTRSLNTNFIVKDGYWYVVKYNKSGVYRINLSNQTDIVELTNKDNITIIVPKEGSSNYTSGSGTTGANYWYSGCAFNCCGEIIYFANGYIDNDRIVKTSGRTTLTQEPYGYGNHCCGRPNVKIGQYILWVASRWDYNASNTAGWSDLYINWMTPYLATINNLEKPVEKTADKTMKITYILREES